MSQPVFVANLLMSTAVLAVAFADAYPRREHLAFLAAAVPYGVVLEQLVIWQFHRYDYPVDAYLLTVADVPLVIGFGWAALIYAGYRTARRFDLSAGRLPLFVGLFALHVDVAIDAVAIRAGFWTWTPPGVWFGVPLGNFLGWFLVASLFAAGWSLLRERVANPLLRGAATVVLAVAALIVALQLWSWVATTLVRRVFVLGSLLGGSVLLVGLDRPRFASVPWTITAIPLAFHGFYLVLLVGLGFALDRPLLLLVSGLMLGLTGLLHWTPRFRSVAATRSLE
jgi:uncharacterized membrane protein